MTEAQLHTRSAEEHFETAETYACEVLRPMIIGWPFADMRYDASSSARGPDFRAVEARGSRWATPHTRAVLLPLRRPRIGPWAVNN